MAYAQDILNQGLNQHQTYHAVLGAIHKKYPILNDSNISRLSPGERAFILTMDLSGRISGDGFFGYFMNTQCQAIHETIRCFSLIGATNDLDIIRRAVQIAKIPDPLPATFVFPDRDDDDDVMRELMAELRKLDREFYKSKNDLHCQMLEYVRNHLNEFE